MEFVVKSLAAIVILAIIGGIALLAWKMGPDFALGGLFGIVLYQLAHRARYGKWFDI